jgi:hypothetical protein
MLKRCLFFILVLLTFRTAHAQADTTKPLRIGVLAPLYIDSAFDGYTYKLGTTNIPKYILPGLEFYNGVMLAVEHLQKENVNVEVWVYDTKKSNADPIALQKTMDLTNFNLLIGSFNNVNEQKFFADFAAQKNIPLVSATYPNDALLKSNPFFIMLNPTIQTHINGIYNYLTRMYPVNSNILFVTRKGQFEDRLRKQFNTLNASKKINYKVIEMKDDGTTDIDLYLDSTTQNVIVAGSLNETFATNLVTALNDASAYKSVVVGMPNWDGIKGIDKSSNNNVEIIYSTPFNFSSTHTMFSTLYENYKTKYFSRPSDMVFKAYETMYRFAKLLDRHKNNLLNNLSDPSFNVWNSFTVEPVKVDNTSLAPDYLENKKLYFIRKQNGKTVGVY